MEEQEITIRDLELALQAKINPLKLAETRLENRKMALRFLFSVKELLPNSHNGIYGMLLASHGAKYYC